MAPLGMTVHSHLAALIFAQLQFSSSGPNSISCPCWLIDLPSVRFTTITVCPIAANPIQLLLYKLIPSFVRSFVLSFFFLSFTSILPITPLSHSLSQRPTDKLLNPLSHHYSHFHYHYQNSSNIHSLSQSKLN